MDNKLYRYLKAPDYYRSIFKKLWVDDSLYLIISDERFKEILSNIIQLYKSGSYSEALSVLDFNMNESNLNSRSSQEQSVYHYYHAALLFYNEQHEKSKDAMKKAITLDTMFSFYHHNLAVILFSTKDYEMVIDELELARTATIPFYVSSAYLALVYSFEKEWKKSFICAQEAKQHQVEPRQLVELCLMISSYYTTGKVVSQVDFSSLYNDKANFDALVNYFPIVKYLSNTSCNQTTNKIDYCKQPCVYFACDKSYFINHCVFSILSLSETKVPTSVHVHLFNYSTQDRELVNLIKLLSNSDFIELSLSYETVNYYDFYVDKPLYCSCIRFVRAYQHLSRVGQSILIMDCDSLFTRPISFINEKINKPIAVLGDDFSPEWEQLAAGVVFCNQSDGAKKYLKYVSSFIMDNFKKNKAMWFLDQIGLKFTYEICFNHNPDIYQQLPSGLFCDLNYSENSYIWMVTNKKEKDSKYSRRKEYLKSKYKL